MKNNGYKKRISPKLVGGNPYIFLFVGDYAQFSRW